MAKSIADALRALEHAMSIIHGRPCERVASGQQRMSCYVLGRKGKKTPKRFEPDTDRMCDECAAYELTNRAVRLLDAVAKAERQKDTG